MKPMLACDYDASKLKYPCIASPKLDGVRGLVSGGKLLSRSLKLIPNLYVQEILGATGYEYLDGELIVGSPTDKLCYTNTVSHVMAINKRDFAFTYYVFDVHSFDGASYAARRRSLEAMSFMDGHPHISLLEQREIHSEEELLDYEQEKLAEGYEGLILRDPNGLYKFGRSTVNEGLLLKVKRFADGEARIIGFEEQQKNNNPKTVNELGRGKRSSHQENKVGKDTLGALHVKDIVTGVDFHIGTGMNDELRAAIWAETSSWMGKIVKYKHFTVGSVDKPRHPVYLGLRADEDM
jgi:DNA ligase-1